MKSDLISDRAKCFSKSLKTSYNEPLYFKEGKGCYLFDENGEAYLDVYNNVPHVGHSHPKVVEAIINQVGKLNTNTRYLSKELTEYAKKLLSKFPCELNVCFFVNSGSEASDLALRLAREYKQNNNTIVLENGFHGSTLACTEVSHYKHVGKNLYNGSVITPNHVIVAPVPYLYRGVKDLNYAKEVERVIVENKLENNLGAFISESLQGVGGQVVYPNGYLKEVYEIVRKSGGLCIADEVQVGFGRVGTHFWAFETQDVIPDIVVLGKPIGNGFPLGAVVTKREIADSLKVEYFSTFGGSNVSCAVGLAVLEVIDEEKLQENAFKVGSYFMNCLNELKEKYEIIGDVRGLGLYIGIEFVKDINKTPATKETKIICEELKKKRILTGIDGPWQNVLRIKPPICFSMEMALTFTNQLESVLQEMSLEK